MYLKHPFTKPYTMQNFDISYFFPLWLLGSIVVAFFGMREGKSFSELFVISVLFSPVLGLLYIQLIRKKAVKRSLGSDLLEQKFHYQYNNKRYVKALKTALLMVDETPSSSSYYLLGKIYWKLGDVAKAKKNLKLALKHGYPANSDSLFTQHFPNLKF